jgi:hypothetical protein
MKTKIFLLLTVSTIIVVVTSINLYLAKSDLISWVFSTNIEALSTESDSPNGCSTSRTETVSSNLKTITYDCITSGRAKICFSGEQTYLYGNEVNRNICTITCLPWSWDDDIDEILGFYD